MNDSFEESEMNQRQGARYNRLVAEADRSLRLCSAAAIFAQ